MVEIQHNVLHDGTYGCLLFTQNIEKVWWWCSSLFKVVIEYYVIKRLLNVNWFFFFFFFQISFTCWSNGRIQRLIDKEMVCAYFVHVSYCRKHYWSLHYYFFICLGGVGEWIRKRTNILVLLLYELTYECIYICMCACVHINNFLFQTSLDV